MTPIQLMTATNAYNDLVAATKSNTRADFLKAVESMLLVVGSEPIFNKVSSLIDADSEQEYYATLANNFTDAAIYAEDGRMLATLRDEVEALQVDALSGDNVVTLPVENTEDDTLQQQQELLAQFQEQVAALSTDLSFNCADLQAQFVREQSQLTTSIGSAIENVINMHSELQLQRLSNLATMTEAIEKLQSTAAALAGQQTYIPTSSASMELLRAIFANGNPMHLAATVRRMARKDKAIGKLALEIIRDVDKEEAYAKHLQSRARSTSINLDDL